MPFIDRAGIAASFALGASAADLATEFVARDELQADATYRGALKTGASAPYCDRAARFPVAQRATSPV
jgi:NAD(P)H-dependent flavin oxidoreductase YrpB (nitropropane dioxygenase family)